MTGVLAAALASLGRGNVWLPAPPRASSPLPAWVTVLAPSGPRGGVSPAAQPWVRSLALATPPGRMLAVAAYAPTGQVRWVRPWVPPHASASARAPGSGVGAAWWVPHPPIPGKGLAVVLTSPTPSAFARPAWPAGAVVVPLGRTPMLALAHLLPRLGWVRLPREDVPWVRQQGWPIRWLTVQGLKASPPAGTGSPPQAWTLGQPGKVRALAQMGGLKLVHLGTGTVKVQVGGHAVALGSWQWRTVAVPAGRVWVCSGGRCLSLWVARGPIPAPRPQPSAWVGVALGAVLLGGALALAQSRRRPCPSLPVPRHLWLEAVPLAAGTQRPGEATWIVPLRGRGGVVGAPGVPGVNLPVPSEQGTPLVRLRRLREGWQAQAEPPHHLYGSDQLPRVTVVLDVGHWVQVADLRLRLVAAPPGGRRRRPGGRQP